MDPYLENPKKFHLEMPLYHIVDIQDEQVNEHVYTLMNYNGTLDAYCIYCDKESIFDAYDWYDSSLANFRMWDNTMGSIKYKCTRDKTHIYRTYYLKIGNISLIKIGQHPSVADFQIPQAEKYRKILGEANYKELTRGIGLKANGVGIGSYVYLRRIFENLIEEAYKKGQKEGKINEEKYQKARMDDKIKLLQEYLPTFLVDNRGIYSILSIGIHSLSEDDCLKYFDSIKIGIEQILDEKIADKERSVKAEAARKAIAGITGVVKK